MDQREKQLERLFIECGWNAFAEITYASFESWRNKLTVSPKTVNEYLQAIQTFPKWAQRSGKIGNNPLAQVEKVDGRGHEGRKRRALSMEELERLLKTSGPRSTLYLVATHTGLRRQELKELLWSDLHLDAKLPFVRVRASTAKNKRSVDLPLHEQAVTRRLKAGQVA